jgi:hypothetical protein
MPTTLPARRNVAVPSDFDDFPVRLLIGLTLILALVAIMTFVEMPIAIDPELFDGSWLSLP